MLHLQLLESSDFALVNYLGIIHLVILFLIIAKYFHYRRHFPDFYFDFFIHFGREEIQLSQSKNEKRSKCIQNRLTYSIFIIIAFDLFLFLLRSLVPD